MKMLGIIMRSFDFIQEDTFIQLYKTMIRPHLEYGNVIWSPQLKRQSIAIEKVQRRATKLVKSCKNLPYEKRLQILNLLILKYKRYRGDLLQLYKIINNIDNDDLDFEKKNTSNTSLMLPEIMN